MTTAPTAPKSSLAPSARRRIPGSATTPILYWTRGTGTNGDADWEFVWAHIAAGNRVDEVGTVVAPGAVTLGPTAVEGLGRTVLGSFSPPASGAIRLAVRRNPVSGGMASDAWLLGVELQYGATS